jgi:hypothetical protein
MSYLHINLLSIGTATLVALGVAPFSSNAAMVVADTATELSLGQARQGPGGRPQGVEVLPDQMEVVFDHANLLGQQTEEALSRELSRVWINQKIEVFIRTVPRNAISGFEPNALNIIRGRSGNVIVLVFTESPSTYLYVMSDKLSTAIGIDGVRQSVQQAFAAANKNQASDARIIATVVALLQEIVKNAGLSNPQPAATSEPTAATAVEPATPSPAEIPVVSEQTPSPSPTAQPAVPVDIPPATSSSSPAVTPEQRPETAPTPSKVTPPVTLLAAGGGAVVLLLLIFAIQKMRPRKSPSRKDRSLSLNAPPPVRNIPRSGAPSASGPAFMDFRNEPRPNPPEGRFPERRERAPTSAETLPDSNAAPEPIVAGERAFSPGASSAHQARTPSQPDAQRRTDTGPSRTAMEPKFSTIRIRKDYSKESERVPEPVPLTQEAAQGEGETEGMSARLRQPAKPTRTPLLRNLGMEPDQLAEETGTDTAQYENEAEPIAPETAESYEQAAPPAHALSGQDDALFERIESYVVSMRRASQAQRIEMLRGLEILLLAYRERIGIPHPAVKQLEMEMRS